MPERRASLFHRTRPGRPRRFADRRVLAPATVFLAAAAFFSVGLGCRDLWTTAEHRYAEVARELVMPGHDVIVPHLNGALYPDKPPGWFWPVGALHRFLDLDLALAARLPSIAGGALIAMLTFLLARRWWGFRAGLVAAGIVATAELFDRAARSGQIDSWFSALIVATLYCFVRATDAREGRARLAWTALGYASVGAGILVKGPAAVAIPAAVVVAFFARTCPRRLLTWTCVWGAAIAAIPGLAWLLAARSHAGDDYVRALLVGHAVGHAAGQVDKLEPWHYYLWAVPLSLLPWTAFLPGALRSLRCAARVDERGTDRFLVAWLLAPVLLLSLFPAKRDFYLIAVHPAAALLVARLFRDGTAEETLRPDPWMNWPQRLLAGATAVAGAVVLVAAIASLVRGSAGIGIAAVQPRLFGEHYASSRFVLAALFGAAMSACGIAAWLARSSGQSAAALIGAVSSALLLNALVVAPTRDPDKSPRPFLEEVRERIGDAPLARLGDDGGLQYAVNWVLERDHVPEFQRAAAADEFLAASSEPRYLVTDASELLQFGEPVSAVTLLRRARGRGPEFLLLGNAAAARR